MGEEKNLEVRKNYSDKFLHNYDEEWVLSYLTAVEYVTAAPELQFRSADFQRYIWEVDGVTSIGFGSSVVVPGAYTDPDIIEALWQLRQWTSPSDPVSRARHLDAEFKRIMELVHPRHNVRRPRARLARLFTVLRPTEMLCLIDSPRTNQFRLWLEQPSHGLDFIGQHVICRQALRDALGAESSLRDHVLYSQYSWYVWTQLNPKQAEAIAKPDVAGPKAIDTPQLAVLPAKLQRKGIAYVSKNLDLILGGVDGFDGGAAEGDSLPAVSVIHSGSAFGEVDHADADDG